jgi:tetratricopeptide (TPR) repeat protein
VSRFRHAAMREVAYDALLLAERKTRHAEISKWLEETYRGREVEVAAQLAHHHAKAGHVLRAAHFGIQAGNEARSLFANADALRFFEEALALLDNSDEARLSAMEAHAGIGEVQTRLGDFERAIGAWQSAIEGLETVLVPHEQAALRRAYFLRKLAFCYSETGDDEKAQSLLRKAFRALQNESSLASQRERSSIVGDRAFMLYRQGRFAQAARLGRWSYALAQRSGGEDERGDAANLLGLIRQAQGHIDEALNYYTQSQHAAQNSGDLSAAAQALNNLGTVHFHAGRFGEAEECWRDALNSWRKIGDSVQEAWALNNLGNLHLARGSFDKALVNFRQAQTRFHQVKHRFGEAATLAVSGEAHLENGETQAAIQTLHAAQALARELDALDLMAYSGTTLSVALLEAGEDALALQECQSALEQSRAIGHASFEGIAHRTLGCLALKRNDFQTAETELNAALALFSEHALKPEQGRALLALTQYYRALNYTDEAEQCRLKALKIFEEIGAEVDARRAMEI